MQKKYKFTLNYQIPEFLELIEQADHSRIAVWAIDCVERVMPYFEEKYPHDKRPRQALLTLQEWILTGIFRMTIIRKAALSSHAAAREIGEDSPARSAARAAGQAVATAHVPAHAIAAANYSLQAIYRATHPDKAKEAIEKERDWQYKHLLKLLKIKN